MAWHRRDIGFCRCFLGFDLVAHRGNRPRVGPDEDDAGLFERPRKGFTFRQKSIAGMHRFGAGPAAGLDDPVDHQITLRSRRRSYQHGLVGHLDMQRVTVRFGVDRNRADPHPAGGLDDPAGDLAAIGDQNSFEHVLVYLQVSRRGAGLPIWHAWTDVTIPSYRKTRPGQWLKTPE